jgi:hypothetical protein
MSDYYLTIDEYDGYLSILGKRLAERGVPYDIVVSGGFAINRFYGGNRALTHDCDFQFVNPVDDEENSLLLDLAAEVAEEYKLNKDWFNVCDYIVEGLKENLIHSADYDALHLYVPDVRALIAAKTISFRDREGSVSADIQDLRSLFVYIDRTMSFGELLDNAKLYLPQAWGHLTDLDIEERRNKHEIYFG